MQQEPGTHASLEKQTRTAPMADPPPPDRLPGDDGGGAAGLQLRDKPVFRAPAPRTSLLGELF